MAIRPSEYPRWSENLSGGVTGVVSPSSGERDGGWAPGNPVPAQKMNWLNWLAYKWIVWFDELQVDVYRAFGAETGEPANDSIASKTSNSGTGQFEWVINGASGFYVMHTLGVRSGFLLNSAGAWLKPASSTCSVVLWEYDPVSSTSTQLGSTATSSGTSWQLVEVTGLSQAVDPTKIYKLVVVGQNSIEFRTRGGRFRQSRP